MSYDISLCDPVTKETLHTGEAHFMAGGTRSVGGTTELWLNITYNYSRWYYRPGVFPKGTQEIGGIRTLYGMTGAESIPVLKKAIEMLTNLKEDISDEEKKEKQEVQEKQEK